jgi:hypothetical protein
MKFTVLLLYPERIADPYGEDTYLAWVEAKNPADAEHAAQIEVGRANRTTGRDFSILLVAKGWIKDMKVEFPLNPPTNSKG